MRPADRAGNRFPTQKESDMRLGRGFIAAVLALAVTALAAGGASAFASSSPVVGHVYVNDNTAGTNTIAAFDRHADGTLTPVPGSAVAAGGAAPGPAPGPA